MASELEVYVLAAPGRDEAHEQCYRSIEASDIGTEYVVCENPPGLPKRQHWRNTLLRAAEAKTQLVLVLEDDALVNKHIAYNALSWKWPHEPKFGAGWLYSPGGYCGGKDCWYFRRNRDWYGTIAVLYPPRLIPSIVESAWAWMEERGNDAWDLAVAYAVMHGIGKDIRQHGPSLAEHLFRAPSSVGHRHNWSFHTSRGTFRPEWRRPVRDPNGR